MVAVRSVKDIAFYSIWLVAIGMVCYPQNTQAAQVLQEMTAYQCGGCHEQIYTQWKSSMHARSTPLKDPIFALFYQKLVGDPFYSDTLAMVYNNELPQ